MNKELIHNLLDEYRCAEESLKAKHRLELQELSKKLTAIQSLCGHDEVDSETWECYHSGRDHYDHVCKICGKKSSTEIPFSE